MSRRGIGISRAVLAGVVASTLALSACGAEDDSEADEVDTATSSSAEGTSESAAPGTSAESEPSSGARDDTPAPEDEPPADEPDPEAEGAPDAPEAQGEDAPPPPPPAAPRASGDDASQIRGVSEGLQGDRKYADYWQYVYDTTCTGDLDRLGGREGVQQEIDRARAENQMWSEVAGGVENIPTVHGVNDIAVEGDRATATVDRTIGGNRGTENVVYIREDGNWKTCSSAA
ncbi:MAG: hypothetical protein ACTH1D_10865 [Mycobacteriaceae bacterium]|uniref:hypothetical protein n=1 Tax=Corynebacterium sp. TaxID=1720 RepID=UPI003F970A11